MIYSWIFPATPMCTPHIVCPTLSGMTANIYTNKYFEKIICFRNSWSQLKALWVSVFWTAALQLGLGEGFVVVAKVVVLVWFGGIESQDLLMTLRPCLWTLLNPTLPPGGLRQQPWAILEKHMKTVLTVPLIPHMRTAYFTVHPFIKEAFKRDKVNSLTAWASKKNKTFHHKSL